MHIKELHIQNYKSIQDLLITDIENALILVGKNNTGKTAILDAIRVATGNTVIEKDDFQEDYANIEIFVRLALTNEDLSFLHHNGQISTYRRFDKWFQDFQKKLPSYDATTQTLSYTLIANRDGKTRFSDGYQKNNIWIMRLLPPIYYLDPQRNLQQFQDDLLLLQEDTLLKQMRSGCCLFDSAKPCTHCFSCIGLINQKTPAALNAFEAAKLLDYKLYQLNLDDFSRKVNANYRKNGGQHDIIYSMNRNIEQMLSVTAEIASDKQKIPHPIEYMGKGMRSIYMLSLLETYAEDEHPTPGIIIVEEPELFLHPKLQKQSGDLLFRLSRKNQVIFSTHSPNLLPNFNSRQIRQIILDDDGYSTVRKYTDISVILNDLGYSANDLMNVDFVFIVEGRQDKSRLPLLLRKYYSEIYDAEGKPSRVAIITTNSCTNIKTYANLKYINQLYLKDNFLMIRDGDGKDADLLKHQLCHYYDEQNIRDIDHLPRVTERNVLILKYYSFENYFFNPDIMAKLGIVSSPQAFYDMFYEKWRDYLYRLSSGEKLVAAIGHDLTSPEDVRLHMEDIRIHMRGHNLYDIFYGRYKDCEAELLTRYIEIAPRADFKDILDAIDRFIYFENRRK